MDNSSNSTDNWDLDALKAYLKRIRTQEEITQAYLAISVALLLLLARYMRTRLSPSPHLIYSIFCALQYCTAPILHALHHTGYSITILGRRISIISQLLPDSCESSSLLEGAATWPCARDSLIEWTRRAVYHYDIDIPALLRIPGLDGTVGLFSLWALVVVLIALLDLYVCWKEESRARAGDSPSLRLPVAEDPEKHQDGEKI